MENMHTNESYDSSTQKYQVFCDSLQEALWFIDLNDRLKNAEIITIPNTQRDQAEFGIDIVLQYDRPDIILKHGDQIILVIERTVEVPSGHNVGQRFGRLVAAAEKRIPVVYFGPYKAYKHGGGTAGPRYMNLRLFYSLKKVAEYYNSAITTINWPVDTQCEIIKTAEKDDHIKIYMDLFFSYYDRNGFEGLTEYLKDSDFQQEQYEEQAQFAQSEIRNPEQYNIPPDSVQIMSVNEFEQQFCEIPGDASNIRQIVLYNIGMQKIRSDPYAGMAALYYFLYGGADVMQILYFPNIKSNAWYRLQQATKTYRMYKEFCTAILFQNGLVLKNNL